MLVLLHVGCWSESSESEMLAVGMDLESEIKARRTKAKRNEVSFAFSPSFPLLPLTTLDPLRSQHPKRKKT